MTTLDTLTDKAIRAALKVAAQDGKKAKKSDGGGLHLEVQPNGTGWWRFRYRYAGREGMLSLGVYPDVPLAQARSQRDEARRQVAAGINPSAARKAEKAARIAEADAERMVAEGLPPPGSFEHVAREWWGKVHQVKVSEGTAERTMIRFETDVFPWLGLRQMSTIEPPELLKCLRKVEERGAIETAHRIKDACGQVFRYGIAAGYCPRNPAADLKDALQPVQTRHLAAITNPKGAAQLLRDMMGYRGHPVTRTALSLSAMLLLRPGELRQLEWEWVDFDEATISVPSMLMKRAKTQKENDPPHVVPLAEQAVDALVELQPLTGKGRYIFPSMLSTKRCMSENTIRAALRRLGYGNDDMTAHGFRAMARTMIAERLNIDPHIIEAQLDHSVPDLNGRAYNRTQYLDQRRDMMKRWADYLDALRDGDGKLVAIQVSQAA